MTKKNLVEFWQQKIDYISVQATQWKFKHCTSSYMIKLLYKVGWKLWLTYAL